MASASTSLIPFLATLLLGADRPVDFDREIRPIFEASCVKCHGPAKQEGDLRLDLRGPAMAGGLSGEVIVPGKSAASLLVHHVAGLEGARPMPPKGPRLADDQLASIRAWIDQGATWPESGSSSSMKSDHWAYQPPIRRDPPRLDDPAWGKNPIDGFVWDRLRREGLKPSGEADRARLIRRVSLDLTGLPPTVEEVDAFVADVSPGAYDRVVDRLLASPHHGERWGKLWLDLARYADTHGFEKDPIRSIWPYRDWVIQAINADMPFERFTVEQLAGDMLPDATLAQKVASGFHRNTMVNTEGGVDPEEARVATIVDRVNTTATVWLGSTLACAQCHTHKYDPFPQREYYQFFSFFNSAEEPEIDVPNGKTMVMRERSVPRTTRIHVRGNFMNPGDEVKAGVPSVLPPIAEGEPANRLGLARWLVRADNPLTARVLVNRFWEQYFGRGIVGTVEDFGTQGDRPTHPELLDWLATELPRQGWSMKAIHRLIVTSATYRQSSTVTRDLLEKDPDNRLMARGPRIRVDAETIRDVALAASGLLSRKVGGPSVFPPQPEGIWTMIYSNDRWVTSAGDDRYRRGLYTFWRRTAPYPAFVAFDAPSRETSCFRRPRSNTPIQALTTLNDPAFVEAARALARRALIGGGPDPRSKATRMFRLCVARQPSVAELDRIVALFDRERIEYGNDPRAAGSMAGNPPEGGDSADLAAWTVVANVLLNLDETITKE